VSTLAGTRYALRRSAVEAPRHAHDRSTESKERREKLEKYRLIALARGRRKPRISAATLAE